MMIQNKLSWIIRLKVYLRKYTFLSRIYCDYLYLKDKRLFNKNPRMAAEARYCHAFKRSLDWDNPKDLYEKIYWMLFNTDTSLWTKCADKYRVREYVEEKGCGKYLVKLYGQWDDPMSIDFNKLPNEFVLKANNGCGTVMVVDDKSKLDERRVKKTMKRWLSRPFGYSTCQSNAVLLLKSD